MLASRGSKLALAQAELTAEALRTAAVAEEVEIKKYATTGDRETQWSLEAEGGTGLFTKEIEEAVLRGEADIAVHSAKDLPTQVPDGLAIAAFLPRAPAHDILVAREGIEKISFIASGSPRRRQQLKHLHPCAVWKEIRGNVGSRLKKIADGKADATILAAAGLSRLGIKDFPGLTFQPLSLREVVPAAGQGAIALQTRAEDVDTLSAVDHAPTHRAVDIERHLLASLGGGCHAATAAHVVGQQLLIYHEQAGFREFPLDETENLQENLAAIVQTLLDSLNGEG